MTFKKINPLRLKADYLLSVEKRTEEPEKQFQFLGIDMEIGGSENRNLKGQCCLMSSYRRWGVKSQMLQFCKSNLGSVLNIRKFSNLLQVSCLWMYQVPLVYPCAGSKGSTGIFLFIPLCTS